MFLSAVPRPWPQASVGYGPSNKFTVEIGDSGGMRGYTGITGKYQAFLEIRCGVVVNVVIRALCKQSGCILLLEVILVFKWFILQASQVQVFLGMWMDNLYLL